MTYAIDAIKGDDPPRMRPGVQQHEAASKRQAPPPA